MAIPAKYRAVMSASPIKELKIVLVTIFCVSRKVFKLNMILKRSFYGVNMKHDASYYLSLLSVVIQIRKLYGDLNINRKDELEMRTLEN